MELTTKQDFINTLQNNGNALAEGNMKKNILQILENSHLPTTKDEEWRKTDIKPLLHHKFEYGQKIELDKTIISLYNLSGTYANVLVFINGHICDKLSKIIDTEAITFESIRKLKQEQPQLFEKYFNKTELYKKHFFATLNTAFAEDGSFLLIKKGKKVENPIHVYHFSDGQNKKIVSLMRNLIIAEKGSKAHILHSYHSLSENYQFTNIATEIFVKDDAYLDFNIFEGEGDDAFMTNTTFVQLAKGSQFYSHTATMCGRIVRNDLNIVFENENAYAEANGLYLPDRDQHFNNTVFIDHKSGYCLSKQFYRGILDNNATAVFAGNVLIRKNSVGSEAHQTNNNILLSKHSKVHSKPHLIIHNDDVAASHGSTVGQLDPEQLFYMQARGISKKHAKTLLLTAFIAEVADKIRIPQYHFYIKYLIERRMAGEKVETMCAKMGICRK